MLLSGSALATGLIGIALLYSVNLMRFLAKNLPAANSLLRSAKAGNA
jgi:hypothetical protein